MKKKVIKTGNSLVVTIPAEFVKSVGVRKGDNVVVAVNKTAFKITYTFSGVCQLSLSDALK